MCNSFFAEEPRTHDEYLRMEFGETKSPVIKYQCNGEHILDNVKFVKTPPLIQFLLSEEVANKVSDISSIQKEVNIYGENYVLGGCTAFIYCRKNDLYYYYDALRKSFTHIKDLSLQNGGQLPIITYFRTKPEHQK